ncbi:InlB B-repeat-containing protein [Pseudoalteromonas sp. SG44-17]|uniref:InlB B-repeat-containing protein n=1 Tax=Pseudoalteromonas sp. SG44-17 TaxID=2760963 RepID=UPI00160362E1|nr:choice-of-anchor U domain-containing protein [Pseudoalteromonas sp. SG44-17]MBB1408640.1 peptidoglycan DD-metalloendopeptidase family protein [Pseudoalteromonas sp. SG44-17]
MNKSVLFVLCALLTACGGSDDNKKNTEQPIQSYTISTDVKGEGQLQPTSLVLKQGESGTFELQPSEGYKVANVEGCNGTYSNNNYTIESATQSCQVIATFDPKTINVTLESDAYISLYADKNKYVYGDSAVINYELSPGYLLDEITGCNGVLSNELYKVDTLTTDCQVKATTLPTSQVFNSEDEEQINVTVLNDRGSILPSSKGIIEPSNPELPALNSTLEFERDLLAVDIATEAGQTIELQITYENTLPAQFTYQKLIAQQWQALDQDNITVSDDRLTLTLTLTDGGAGDSDGVINGVIKDPGGPAVIRMHSVTVNQSIGGAITPESLAVAHGDTALFTISTDAGYSIESVTGCNGNLNGTSYQTAAITQNCEISAEYSLTSFLVTAQAGEGGQISPLEQLATYGDTVTFTVTADEGHNIESVQGCNGLLTGNIYTTGFITAECEVRATFDPQTVLVTAQAGAGGSISPMSQELNIGQQASLIVTPNEGYSIANVTGCNGSLNGNTFTTGAVTSNCEVQASFSLNSYTVSASTGEGGAISPATQTVNHGSNAQFTVTANEGHSIDSVTGCNGSLNGNTYTTGAVTANCQVQASFSINSYAVSASASEGGTVNPATQSVNHGSNAQITITPNSGYSINTVTGCNGSLSGNTYTTGAVTANCSVISTFTDNRPDYQVSISTSVGGSVTASEIQVKEGEQASFEITANEGFFIFNADGCGGQLAGNTYTTGPINNDCSVAVQFKENTSIAENTKIISLNTPQPDLMEVVWLIEGTNLTEQDIASATHQIYISEQPIEDVTQVTMAKEVSGVFTTQLENLTANTQYYVKIKTQVGSAQLLSLQESILTPKQSVIETGSTHSSAEKLLLEPTAITSNAITYRLNDNSELPKVGDILYSNDLEKLSEFNYLRKVVSTQTNNNQVEVTTENAGISDVVQSGEFNSSFTLFEPITYEPQNSTSTNNSIQTNQRKLQATQYKTNTQVKGQELEQRIIMKDAGLMVVQKVNKSHSPEVKQYIEQNEKIRSLQQPLSFKDKLLTFIAPNQAVQGQTTQSTQVKHGIMISGLPEQLSGNFDDKFSFQSHILLVEPEKYSLNNITWSLTHSDVEDDLENFGAKITANSDKNTDWPIYFEWQPEKYHGVTKGKAYTVSITVEVLELDCSFSCKEEINVEFPIVINEITNELDDGISINLPANRIGKVGQNLELDFSAEIAKQSDIDDDIAITGYEVVEFKIGEQNFELPEFKNGFSDSSSSVSDTLNWYPTSVQHEVFTELYEQQGDIVPFELTVAVTAKDLQCSRTLDRCEDDTVEVTVDLFIQKDINLGTGSKRIMLYENNTKTVQLGFDYELGFEPRLDMGIELQGGEIDNARLMLGGKLDFDLEAFATLEGKFEKTYKTGDMSKKDESNQPIYDREPLYKKTYYKVYALGYVPVVQQIDFVIDAEATFSADASIEFKNDFSFSKFIEMGLVYENGQWRRVQNDGTTQSLEFTTKVAANANLNVKLIPKLSTKFYKVATAGLALEPALNTSLGVEGILQVDHNSQEGFYNYRLHDATASYHIALTGWADLSVWGKTLVKYPKDAERALIWEYPAQGNVEQLRAATLFSVPTIELGIAQHQGAMVTLEATTQAGRSVFSSNKTNEFVPLSNAWQVFTLSNNGQTTAPYQLTEPQAGLTDFTGQLGNVYTIYYVGHDSVIGKLARNYQSIEIDYTDEDADGMPLYWEQQYCINGASPDYRGEADIDNDGLSNLEEFAAGTQPNTCNGSNSSQDSDGDGMPDGWEVKFGLNPLVDDAQQDSDGDGIVNIDEYQAGTDPSPVRTQITAIEILGQTSLEHGESAQFSAQVTYSDNSTEQVQGLWQLNEEYTGVTLSQTGLLTTQASEQTRVITLSVEFLGNSSTLAVTLIPTVSPIDNVVDGFDYPLGNRGLNEQQQPVPFAEQITQELNHAYTKTQVNDNHTRTTNSSTGWRNAQDTGSFLGNYGGTLFGGVHPGEDWNTTNDAGEQVYAIANGKVTHLQPTYQSGYQTGGYTMIIEHTLTDGSNVYSLYTHITAPAQTDGTLSENTQEFSVQIGDAVSRGQVIARLAKGMTALSPHLHFELRTIAPGSDLYPHDNGIGYYSHDKAKHAAMTAEQIASAYTIMKNDEGLIDPSDFIDFNRSGVTGKVTNISAETATGDVLQYGQPFTLTIEGENLPPTIAAAVHDANCETIYAVTAQSAKLDCTPNNSGELFVYVKQQSGGVYLHGAQDLWLSVAASNNNVLGVEFADTHFAQCVQAHVSSQQVTRLADLTTLDCSNKGIASVVELSYMTGLTSLNLANNNLTTINLDDNLALNSADLRGNQFDESALFYIETINWITYLKYKDDQILSLQLNHQFDVTEQGETDIAENVLSERVYNNYLYQGTSNGKLIVSNYSTLTTKRYLLEDIGFDRFNTQVDNLYNDKNHLYVGVLEKSTLNGSDYFKRYVIIMDIDENGKLLKVKNKALIHETNSIENARPGYGVVFKNDILVTIFKSDIIVLDYKEGQFIKRYRKFFYGGSKNLCAVEDRLFAGVNGNLSEIKINEFDIEVINSAGRVSALECINSFIFTDNGVYSPDLELKYQYTYPKSAGFYSVFNEVQFINITYQNGQCFLREELIDSLTLQKRIKNVPLEKASSEYNCMRNSGYFNKLGDYFSAQSNSSTLLNDELDNVYVLGARGGLRKIGGLDENTIFAQFNSSILSIDTSSNEIALLIDLSDTMDKKSRYFRSVASSDNNLMLQYVVHNHASTVKIAEYDYTTQRKLKSSRILPSVRFAGDINYCGENKVFYTRTLGGGGSYSSVIVLNKENTSIYSGSRKTLLCIGNQVFGFSSAGTNFYSYQFFMTEDEKLELERINEGTQLNSYIPMFYENKIILNHTAGEVDYLLGADGSIREATMGINFPLEIKADIIRYYDKNGNVVVEYPNPNGTYPTEPIVNNDILWLGDYNKGLYMFSLR